MILPCVCIASVVLIVSLCFFFFNDTATTEIYTLSLHDALPICLAGAVNFDFTRASTAAASAKLPAASASDRKSTRLNSSHLVISYAVFCLKKKPKKPVRRMVAALKTKRDLIAHWLDKLDGIRCA